ncbi:MAG: 23S rRNA (adenine(2503)-C(2))-methyltransferase RlmN [Candidatus Absconditabacterales bacterium]
MISIFDQQALEQRLKEHNLPAFRKKQIYTEIFTNSIIDFQEMTTLSLELRSQLSESFCIIPFAVDSVHENPDSTKIGFQLANGTILETVVMYHHHERVVRSQKEKFLNRVTICISSQVGCPVGCIFCVTGKLGFGKNLDYSEMIAQIVWVNHYLKDKLGKKEDGTWRKVRNVVFMGMGEPLLNYDNVKVALEYMLKQEYLSLSKRHVTISTSGIIPGIDKLIADGIDCMLALSLHAPNQVLREKLIPTIAKGYTLDKLMDAIDRYEAATGNRIFYEYIMIKDMTDLPELAHELVTLLKDRNSHVNLIPYNPNPAMPDLEESPTETILAFRDVLERAGITVTARINRGRKIKGACGQLGYEKVSKGEKVIFEGHKGNKQSLNK